MIIDTNKNKSYQLTATTTLTGVKANVNWSSSNNAVATIDASSGNLTIKGTAIITTKADDSAKATVTVTVKSVDKTAPKNVKVNSVKVDSVTLSWNALTAVSNKGKFTKVSTVKNAKKTTFLDKKVSSKKTYYYKVRAYKTVKGKKIYGAYSVVKKVKCK